LNTYLIALRKKLALFCGLDGRNPNDTLEYVEGVAESALEWLEKVDLKRVSQVEISLEKKAVEKLMVDIREKLTDDSI